MLGNKQKTLTEEQKKTFKAAISKLYPGEKNQKVYDAFFSYVEAQANEWSASTENEYETVVKRFYDIALLTESSNSSSSNSWNILMRASMLGGVATLVAFLIYCAYNKLTDQDVRSRLYPNNNNTNQSKMIIP